MAAMSSIRATLFAALLVLSLACSYVEVKAPDATWVIGRTMELGAGGGAAASDGARLSTSASLPPKVWDVVVHPRGPDGNRTNRFGYIGVDASVTGGPSDGMNEAGLTISLQTMRMAEYQSPEEGKQSIGLPEFIPWVLGQHDSVPAVIAALSHVRVVSNGLPPAAFLHWAIADPKGNSIVLEYVGGQPVIHNNTVRVMTNDPDFPWHLKNLNMYVGLSPQPALANQGIQVDTEVGAVPQVWSQGFNLLGLPGDSSPASRFVRLFYLRQYATLRDPVGSIDDAIVLTTGLLNNVFIPRGVVATMTPAAGVGDYDFTQYALIKIPAKKRFLFRGYSNMAWQEVDLNKVAWDKRRSMPLWDGSLGIQDVSGKFQGGEFALNV